ncbi:MAG: cell wall-binding repeat-containing protein, partial [Clostridia bacterium]|nr:cell wall-binding repeat-containing protein [Clostridia bacterium]
MALINSNMMQINLSETLAQAILYSRSECVETVYLGGGMAWYDGRMSFSNRVYPEPMDNIENTKDVLVSLNSRSMRNGWEFTPNSFDAAMVDVVGGSSLRITLTRTEVTPDIMTYHVAVKVWDDFDFNGTQNMGTIIGGWLTGTVIDTYSWDVTLDFSITVSNPCLHRSADYRWDFEILDAVSYGTESTEKNPLTKIQAVKEDGTLGAPYYEMERTVRLNHDKPWVMEIRMRGGGAVCIAKDKSFRENAPFLFKLGYRVQGGYPEKYIVYDEDRETEVSRYNRHMYGVNFRDSGYTYTKCLTYRLENRVAEDGSNMVWLLVEGTEIGPMIHYEQQLHDEENGATKYVDMESTADWIDGVDFALNYIGTGNYKLFPGTELEFIQIWENGEGNAPYSYFETTTIAPTCTEPGKTVHTCTLCGASYEEATGEPAMGHTLETLPGTAATCETEGLTEGTRCTTCGEIVTAQEVIPALGHDWDEVTIIVPAACETDGEIRFTCNRDPSHTRVDTLTPPGHVPGAPASCTAAQTCNSCGIELFPALGHTWNEGEVLTKPSPEGDGLTRYTCLTCGEIREEVQPYEGPVRIAGRDRFETALLTADQMKKNLGIEKFDAVIVASGLDFADALAGSYLASTKNAPILLAYTKDSVNDGIKHYIRENLKEGGIVYILGGENAVPSSFEEELETFQVKRLAGAHRFETNLMILAEAGISDKLLLISTGLTFADSLSASAAKLPILLVYGDKLLPEQADFLTETG